MDISKMDPKVLMELSQLVQQLPPHQLSRMQTLMHNMMAGFDVKKDMEEFEKSLPPGFREKLVSLMASQPGAFSGGFGPGPAAASEPVIDVTSPASADLDLRGARMTILRAVAAGSMDPEEAERLLFPSQ